MSRHGRHAARVGAMGLVIATLVACTTVYRARGDEAASTPVPEGGVRVYVAGDIADCRTTSVERSAARLTAQLVPEGATVLAPGDMVYQWADTRTLQACYEPTWGRHRARTLAVPGNHDYVDGSARDFRHYFGLDGISVSAEFVAYARPLSDDWLLIALDSNVDGAAMQRQVEWLKATLAAARGTAPTQATASSNVPASSAASSRCLAVMWHTPVYSSGLHRGSGEHMRPLWRLIDDHDADLLLSGHEHFYEAFDPIDGEGRVREDGDGVRQFTVGTGGARLYGFWRPPYQSRSRVLQFGVLELTLAPGHYRWRFLDIDGRVRDAGKAACRRSTGALPAASGVD
jgi:hypothetical protein